MPGCFLNASGGNFDVDAFMAQSTWRGSASVFRKGEPSQLRDRPVLDHSRLGVRVSDSDQDALGPQIRDAMNFLDQERSEIQRLAAFAGLECLELRIGLFWHSDTLCQVHTLPPEFLRLAADLGVAVTLCIYAASGEPEAGAPPNGGSAEPLGNSGVGGGRHR